MPRKALDGKTQSKVIAWYEHGDSIRIIAERTGASYGQVHKILTTNSVTLRPRGGANRAG